ncbi:MAG: TRAP transporter large permease [Lachnospiraceae bacterium]|nr:TRAP transporter large permease [Lachnospiraceae bacterium]
MLGLVLGVFFVLMFLGIPICGAMIVGAFVPYWLDGSFTANMNVLLRSILSATDSTPTLAIPLFMLSGAIMANGGISEKLFDIFAVFIGKMRAGMPCDVVVTCLFFGAISGSGAATCAAVGAMCIPVLLDLGYDKLFAAAIVATASGLGIIIPPSTPFIMYGVPTGTSVGDMFKAGIIPGILIAFCLILYCILYCTRHGEDREKIDTKVDNLRAQGIFHILKEGIWALLTPVIILGGIYSGIVTPTEAACVSVFYALFVSLFIYKTMKFSDLFTFMKNAVSSYAGICVMLCFAAAFSRVITLLNVPTLVANFVVENCSSRFVFLMAVNIAMLIMGMFMDTSAALVILAPIMVKSAAVFGISAVQFGIILTVDLALGMVSPPVGISLFIIAPMIGEKSSAITKAVLGPIFFFIIALLLITFIPAISMCLV